MFNADFVAVANGAWLDELKMAPENVKKKKVKGHFNNFTKMGCVDSNLAH